MAHGSKGQGAPDIEVGVLSTGVATLKLRHAQTELSECELRRLSVMLSEAVAVMCRKPVALLKSRKLY